MKSINKKILVNTLPIVIVHILFMPLYFKYKAASLNIVYIEALISLIVIPWYYIAIYVKIRQKNPEIKRLRTVKYIIAACLIGLIVFLVNCFAAGWYHLIIPDFLDYLILAFVCTLFWYIVIFSITVLVYRK
ncbi:MAG: hypothetical protein PHF97_08225 [Bacteroidales bacterium]|nr:hypothetical protein [Bacteroidales bacterium]